jgi:hypothetical protein
MAYNDIPEHNIEASFTDGFKHSKKGTEIECTIELDTIYIYG